MHQVPDQRVLAAQVLQGVHGGGLALAQHGCDGRVPGQGQPDGVERLRPLVFGGGVVIAAA
jgi:hypothetical protein